MCVKTSCADVTVGPLPSSSGPPGPARSSLISPTDCQLLKYLPSLSRHGQCRKLKDLNRLQSQDQLAELHVSSKQSPEADKDLSCCCTKMSNCLITIACFVVVLLMLTRFRSLDKSLIAQCSFVRDIKTCSVS